MMNGFVVANYRLFIYDMEHVSEFKLHLKFPCLRFLPSSVVVASTISFFCSPHCEAACEHDYRHDGCHTCANDSYVGGNQIV